MAGPKSKPCNTALLADGGSNDMTDLKRASVIPSKTSDPSAVTRRAEPGASQDPRFFRSQ